MCSHRLSLAALRRAVWPAFLSVPPPAKARRISVMEDEQVWPACAGASAVARPREGDGEQRGSELDIKNVDSLRTLRGETHPTPRCRGFY